MANRVFLCMSQIEDPNAAQYEDDEGNDVLASASYELPVLWCSVFSADDIRMCSVELEADEVDKGEQPGEVLLPVLVTPSETARQRARERKRLFLERFPADLDPIYDEWLQLLEGIDAPYLHVLTHELWGMMEPVDFKAMLHACVRAFEHDRIEDWSVLLQQARFTFDPVTKRASFNNNGTVAIALHGYRWLRPVPWRDD